MMKRILILWALIIMSLTAMAQIKQQIGIVAEGQYLIHNDRQNRHFGSGSLSGIYRLDYSRVSVSPYAGLEFSKLLPGDIVGCAALGPDWYNAFSFKLGFDTSFKLYKKLEPFTGITGNVIIKNYGNHEHFNHAKGWVVWRIGLGLRFNKVNLQAGYQLRISNHSSGTYNFLPECPYQVFARAAYYLKTF